MKRNRSLCLYLHERLTEKTISNTRKDDIENGNKLASKVFCYGLTSEHEFCFSLYNIYNSIGYSTFGNSIRAFEKCNFEPDIDYITVKRDNDILIPNYLQGDLSARCENKTESRGITDYLMNKDTLRSLVFFAGTNECKLMKKSFCSILTRFEKGDPSLIPE